MNTVITLLRRVSSFFRKEKQVLGRMEKVHHFSTKWLAVDALLATLLTVGIVSLTANIESNARTARLTNIGAIELTSPQLIDHMHSDISDGHVFWLGPQVGDLYTVNGAVWGTHWIEYFQKQADDSTHSLTGVRVRTFANADFLAAHLEPLQASLLVGVTTPKGRHAAYDLGKMDEVVVHIPGESAVVEIYFPSRKSVQTLIASADSLIYFQ